MGVSHRLKGKSTGGRYRKVYCATWGSEIVRRMSSRAKLLWFLLATGPDTTLIPGLIPTYLSTLADRLGWNLHGVGRAWKELEKLHLAEADWRAGVVWVPSALDENGADNVNVCIAWHHAI